MSEAELNRVVPKDRLTPVEEALAAVLDSKVDLGSERTPLTMAVGRRLAGPVEADRDLPPYDRATMDGIAIRSSAFRSGQRDFQRSGMARAGAPVTRLENPQHCMEIATGAILPQGADAVVRYEDLEKTVDGFRIVSDEIKKGQSIHPRGSDAAKGQLLLDPGCRIGPGEIGVLASVGVSEVPVMKLPRITLVTSGDELVEIDKNPEPHQIRTSNGYALEAALANQGIKASRKHLPDDPGIIRDELTNYLQSSDALLLSGGVSRGKFDFLPDALDALGVEKKFHRVAQRPGKPFWFGVHPTSGCRVFSFPGNPVSAFLNFHLYFRDWLRASLGLPVLRLEAELTAEMRNPTNLVHFRTVSLLWKDGKCLASEVPMNSSGDFLSLARADGFIRLDPAEKAYAAGSRLELIPYNPFYDA